MAVRKPNPERVCPTCGKTFALKRFFQKTGKRAGMSMGFRPQKHCSRHCGYEAKRNDWAIDKHGYRYCTSNGKYIYEHRIAMERSIGRELKTHETVHHKNGDRADNRIENLELWTTRHGKGQRVSDQLKFAQELLEEYGIHPVGTSSIFVNGLLSL